MNRLLYTLLLGLCFSGLFAQGRFYIGNGSQWVMDDTIKMVASELSLDNDGTFDAGSDASMVKIQSATTPTAVDIKGDNSWTFQNLSINSSDTIELEQSIDVNGTLDIEYGLLDIGDEMLVIGSSGLIASESANQRLIATNGGTIRAIQNLVAPNEVNPGNIGASISSAASPGMTVILRGHQAQSGANGGYGIHRYYDILAGLNTGLNATLRLYYQDAELNGLPENELGLFKSIDGGVNWTYEGADTRNSTENWVEVSGVDGFSRWTIGSPTTSSLPVELADFQVNCDQKTVSVDWTTLSEVNNSHFELQHSRDGRNWETFGSVQGQGTTQSVQQYRFEKKEKFDFSLYRLRQVDINGAVHISDIVSAECQGEAFQVRIFPNPTSGQLFVQLEGEEGLVASIHLVNELGQTLYTETFEMTNGLQNLEFSLENYPAGFYELQVTGLRQMQSYRLIKLRE